MTCEQGKSSVILESLEDRCAVSCSGDLLATGNVKMSKIHAFFSHGELTLWWYVTGVISWSWALGEGGIEKRLKPEKGEDPWRRRLLKWESDHMNVSL